MLCHNAFTDKLNRMIDMTHSHFQNFSPQNQNGKCIIYKTIPLLYIPWYLQTYYIETYISTFIISYLCITIIQNSILHSISNNNL